MTVWVHVRARMCSAVIVIVRPIDDFGTQPNETELEENHACQYQLRICSFGKDPKKRDQTGRGQCDQDPDGDDDSSAESQARY